MRASHLLFLSIVTAGVAGAQQPDSVPIRSMHRDRQIALAISAGPAHVSDSATIYVLDNGRYVQARAGTNGFSCLVEHEDLRAIEPVCYDAEGTRTLLRVAFFREELRGRGMTEAAVRQAVADAFKAGRLEAPSRPGVAYMLSREANMPPHLMFYAPYRTNSDLAGGAPRGERGKGMPFIYAEGTPQAAYVVLVAR